MSKHTNSIYVGKSNHPISFKEISGELVKFQGEEYYKIGNYDSMPPFFMTVVSFSDHWLFISSNGALSAGRKNPDSSLFPYYTVDKIHDAHENTGSKTIIIANVQGRKMIWEPFSDRYKGVYDISRNIYKNTAGNKVIFEEINDDLKLTFRYAWNTTDKYGFVRHSEIVNQNESEIQLEFVDGIQNVLPYGVDRVLQQTYSNLADGYKKNELLEDTGIGLYMLSSIIVDKAEPSEALKTNVVWSAGLDNPTYLISNQQLDKFRCGEDIVTEKDIRATRGAYFVSKEIALMANESSKWALIADLNKDAGEVASLRTLLNFNAIGLDDIIQDIDYSSDQLNILLAKSDAFQQTSDEMSTKRNLSNVLFNIMRGGIFENNYLIQKSDFVKFAENTNKKIVINQCDFFSSLEEEIDYNKLISQAEQTGDAGIIRLCYEYLPLSFSRRHGDPSRPWNQFSINVRNEDGSKSLDYAGNWRDIFQNWEALSLSFPEYIEGIISKFVNASTADGYNPYRITRNGIDWELLEADDPWSNIGYWGDHQIIYLLKLLEISYNHHPQKLDGFLTADQFSFANIPYRIKSYEEIVKNATDTIDFDDELEAIIQERVQQTGSDGKLIWGKDGNVLTTNFTEKLLITMLAKLSNFVPEAGIWLNTQRPEWNDANNALVGNGVSMLTLYQLRRFVVFMSKIFSSSGIKNISISKEVNELFNAVLNAFEQNKSLLNGAFSDMNRKKMVDQLGQAGSSYRQTIYQAGFSEQKSSLQKSSILEFLEITLEYLDHSIKANKREDNLFHSYNLISIDQSGIKIKNLYEMLEGQVNVLASGFLAPKAVADLLDRLKWSQLYRQNQNSYILYPDRELPRFEVKNNIPAELIDKSVVLKKMIAEKDTSIVYQDVVGDYHFNGNFRNASDVENSLTKDSSVEKDLILSIFESVFDHESFTGRSGSFYAFEGLGSIYWHMVSKLLLSVNECYYQALKENADEETLGRIVSHYYEIRAGIGLNKTPEEYGAFPTDAYSHTPGNAGAQQPGMTGQVKEDILARYGELGVFVSEGKISFDGSLLRKEEFLSEESTFNYYDLDSNKRKLKLKSNSLAFTYCQTPIVYSYSDYSKIIVTKKSGQTISIEGNTMTAELSKSLFERRNEMERIDVNLRPRLS